MADLGKPPSSFSGRLPLFPIVVGFSLSFGLLVPTIYDLGHYGEWKQWHPEMEWLAAGVLLLAVTVAVSAAMFGKRRALSQTGNLDLGDDANQRPMTVQFGLRGLLIVTAIAAASLVAVPRIQPAIMSYAVAATVAAAVVGSCFGRVEVRWRILSLVATMFLPFVWVLAYNKPIGYASGLYEAFAIGPALFPSALLIRINDQSGIACAVVIAELALGIWLARRSPLYSMVWLVIMTAMSWFSSLALHALYRA